MQDDKKIIIGEKLNFYQVSDIENPGIGEVNLKIDCKMVWNFRIPKFRIGNPNFTFFYFQSSIKLGWFISIQIKLVFDYQSLLKLNSSVK